MHLKNYNLLFAASLLLYSCSNSKEIQNGDIFFYITHRVENIQSLESETFGSNIPPWKLNEDIKEDEVLFSNACHFYEIEYLVERLEHIEQDLELEEIAFIARPGEWCDLREYVYPHAQLVVVKHWGSDFYIEEFEEIYQGKQDKYFIVNPTFITQYKLDRYYEDLDNESIESTCQIENKQTDKTFNANMIMINGLQCYTKGVYLNKLINDQFLEISTSLTNKASNAPFLVFSPSALPQKSLP